MKLPPEEKRYRNGLYYLAYIEMRKKDALTQARYLRNKGYSARIYVDRDLIGIYTRLKVTGWRGDLFQGAFLKSIKS